MELVEPRPFQEGWDHPEIKQCMKWREAIRKEFSDMNKQQVWHKIIRDKIPKGMLLCQIQMGLQDKKEWNLPCLLGGSMVRTASYFGEFGKEVWE